MSVEAELKRRDPSNALVDWDLVLDTLSATGLADPVIEAGLRAALGNITDPSTANTVVGILKALKAALQAQPVNRTDAFHYGQVTIAPSASATVVSLVVATDVVVTGIAVAGEGDGRFILDVDGVPLLPARINAAAPSAFVSGSTGRIVSAGSTITLTVTSRAIGSALFEGSVLIG